jgi:hypothetical protein
LKNISRGAKNARRVLKVKNTRGILAGLLLVFGLSTECQALSALEQSYAYILIRGTDPQAVKVVTLAGTKELNYLSETFLDIAAEILLQRYASPDTDKEIKRDLLMLLYESGNVRYSELLLRIGPLIGHHEVNLTLQDRAPRRRPKDVAAFQPGAVSLEQLLQQYIATAKKAPAQDAAKNFAAIAADMNAGEVVALLGNPQATDAEYVGSFFSRHARLLWAYRGLGAVLLQKARSAGPDKIEPGLTWQVTGTIPDPYGYEYLMPYNYFGSAAAREKSEYVTLLHARGLGLRRLTESWHTNRTKLQPELLDIAAERLLQEYRLNVDADTLEGLIWITKLLVRNGEGRYATVLQEILQHAPHSKLKRAAQRNGATLKRDAPQYLKGSISLDDLRKKYQSPY